MSEDQEIGLDEFAEELFEDVQSFITSWRAGVASDPSNWPTTMGAGDWWDQFLAHVDRLGN